MNLNGGDARTGPVRPLGERRPSRPPRPGAKLSPREFEVLRGMVAGKNNVEIGAELFISDQTVKTHARRMYLKLGARSRAEAVALALTRNLVGTQVSADPERLNLIKARAAAAPPGVFRSDVVFLLFEVDRLAALLAAWRADIDSVPYPTCTVPKGQPDA